MHDSPLKVNGVMFDYICSRINIMSIFKEVLPIQVRKNIRDKGRFLRSSKKGKEKQLVELKRSTCNTKDSQKIACLR